MTMNARATKIKISRSTKRTYMPLWVMLEPTGLFSLFSAFFSWLYFHNTNYMNSGSTFTRICGWQSIHSNH